MLLMDTSTTATPQTDHYDPIEMAPLETRRAIYRNGFEPLQLIGKAPMLPGWQSVAINEVVIDDWANTGPNTGIRTARAPAIDVDILDSDGARVARDTLQRLWDGKGKILERVGQHPKFAILLRADTPFRKIIRKLRNKDGQVHKIEVLADGQQIAVAGIHPDTKEPFRWRNGLSPVNTSRAELPLVDEDEVRAMLDLIAEELKNKLKWVEADAAPAADANGHDTGATYVPISERVERMQYGGEYPINDTLLAYSGEQLRGGAPSDDVIKDCLARAQKAYDDIPGDPQERPIWDWTKMHHQIEAMVYGYIEKNYKDEPRLIETLPAGMLEKWRKIEKLGGSPTFRKRRHWGVEDTGPAEPLPIMDAPPILPTAQAPRRSSDTNQRTCSCPSRRSTLHRCRAAAGFLISTTCAVWFPSRREWVVAVNRLTALLRLSCWPQRSHCFANHPASAVAFGITAATTTWRSYTAASQRFASATILDMAELEGWLFLTTPREFELRVAEGYMDVKTDDATINRIHDQVEANAIDVAILDPLVKLHSVREADVGMDRVIGVFQAVADEHGCSVEIVHHTRKGVAGQGDAMQGGDDMRGSSSIQGAVRSSAWSMSCPPRRRPGCKSQKQTAAVISALPMKRRITRHQGMVDGSSSRVSNWPTGTVSGWWSPGGTRTRVAR